MLSNINQFYHQMVAVTIIKKIKATNELKINPNFNLLIWFFKLEIVSWSLFLACSNLGMISVDLTHIGGSNHRRKPQLWRQHQNLLPEFRSVQEVTTDADLPQAHSIVEDDEHEACWRRWLRGGRYQWVPILADATRTEEKTTSYWGK